MRYFTKLLFSFIFLFSVYNSYGIAYVPAGPGPANWNVATSWSPNGIPTNADDVTIPAGTTIAVTANNMFVRNLNVAGTLNFTGFFTLYIYGDYTVTGSQTGSAYIGFRPGGTTISGSGTFSTTSRYTFFPSSNRTIAAGTVFPTTGGQLLISGNCTLTNLGTMTVNNTYSYTSSGFINGTNATLTIRTGGFMSNGSFTASAAGNTVNLFYPTGTLPATTSGFYNLSLTSSVAGTKTLLTNTIVANNLTMNSNNHLNSNNFDLTVGGNWTNAATFTASAGNVVTLNGTFAQTMSNTSGTTTFTNLTIDNTSTGVTLTSGTYILSEVLTVSNGTFNTGGRPFTMTSTAATTARIAPISGTGAIAGNFTIQRFITARDTSWADLSSPVQNSTFIDWDNELPAIYYGAYPTQYTWDEAADDYSPVSSSGTALTPGLGFEVFLSGDFNYSAFPITTINTIGVPNQGDQDLSGLVSFNGGGANLVGNPFASSISWSSVLANSSGLYDYFEMYDYTTGGYSGFDSGSGVEIGATQGFWVYADGGALTLNIPESAKTTSSNSSIRSALKPLPYFTLKMSSASTNFSHTLKVKASYDASNGWDSKDIPFRRSPNKATPVFASVADGKKQTINTFNSSDDNYSMPLVTEVTVSGDYKIEAAGFNFVPEYTCIKLEDRLLNKVIDLTNENVYSFRMNSTDNNDRFVVHFSKDGNCKSFTSANVLSQDFNEQVEILPTAEGNQVNFNLSESTDARINITNIIGQNLIEPIFMTAQSQSVNVSLPSDYSGIYLIKIESSKGIITKKYVRK